MNENKTKIIVLDETGNEKGRKPSRKVASRAVLRACPWRESDGTRRTFELRA